MKKIKKTVGLCCPPRNQVLLGLFVSYKQQQRLSLYFFPDSMLLLSIFSIQLVREFGFGKSANVFIAFENGSGITGRKKMFLVIEFLLLGLSPKLFPQGKLAHCIYLQFIWVQIMDKCRRVSLQPVLEVILVAPGVPIASACFVCSR